MRIYNGITQGLREAINHNKRRNQSGNEDYV